ncbi:MAG: hypothetical protein GY753_04410 [Gammaproteobacteria bacterium]|nr:hypothetical protein [Gammaproteobacteria bacterium]
MAWLSDKEDLTGNDRVRVQDKGKALVKGYTQSPGINTVKCQQEASVFPWPASMHYSRHYVEVIHVGNWQT